MTKKTYVTAGLAYLTVRSLKALTSPRAMRVMRKPAQDVDDMLSSHTDNPRTHGVYQTGFALMLLGVLLPTWPALAAYDVMLFLQRTQPKTDAKDAPRPVPAPGQSA